MRSVVDLLIPPTCPGCGREGTVLCARCLRPFERRLAEPVGAPVGLPGALPEGLVQHEWCAAFTGPARAAVHALKYDGERRLGRPLAAVMAHRWRRAAVGGEVLVPVPIHVQRRRERGFDQAELLAEAVGLELRLPVIVALERRDETRAQHRLGRHERARNVRGAFGIRVGKAAAIRGRWVVLIDDVSTTGATLSGCAAALLAAGAEAVSALTFARER